MVRLPQDVRFRRFDAEALVFNPLTWETHLLTGKAASVLACLLRSPASIDELVQSMADSWDEGTPPDVRRESVSRVLEELRDLELIGEGPGSTDATPRS